MPVSWVPELAQRCEACEVAFMTTPYDLGFVDQIDPFVPAWKIGSGDVTFHELIRYVARKGKPVFLATGASTAEEVDGAFGAYLDGSGAMEYGQNLVLMQCNTNYTGDWANFRHLNLRVLKYWADNYGTPVGLSSHVPGYLDVCAAIALGACAFEKHFTDDCGRTGPDHGFALEPEQWQEMVEAAADVWDAMGDGVKKVEENEGEARIIQRRALRWFQSRCAGEQVVHSWVFPTRPCPKGGLEPHRIGEVVGKTLARNVKSDTLVRLEDLE